MILCVNSVLRVLNMVFDFLNGFFMFVLIDVIGLGLIGCLGLMYFVDEL